MKILPTKLLSGPIRAQHISYCALIGPDTKFVKGFGLCEKLQSKTNINKAKFLPSLFGISQSLESFQTFGKKENSNLDMSHFLLKHIKGINETVDVILKNIHINYGILLMILINNCCCRCSCSCCCGCFCSCGCSGSCSC